jgi:hypothetical protein
MNDLSSMFCQMTESQVIEKVETFIRHCNDLDYVFTPDSRKLGTTNQQGERAMFADSIARAMSEYEWFKNDPQQRMLKANICLMWINRAFAVGVVREGEGLVNKNKALEHKVAELQSTVKKLSDELERLRDAE